MESMKSINAIAAGSAFIVVIMLVLQLAYVFIAVGYIWLTKHFPFLDSITDLFRYVVGIPVFMAIMFAGGYITAAVAKMQSFTRVWVHCLAVVLITVGSTFYFALENADITTTGVVVTVLALSACSVGGFYWLRQSAAG